MDLKEGAITLSVHTTLATHYSEFWKQKVADTFKVPDKDDVEDDDEAVKTADGALSEYVTSNLTNHAVYTEQKKRHESLTINDTSFTTQDVFDSMIGRDPMLGHSPPFYAYYTKKLWESDLKYRLPQSDPNVRGLLGMSYRTMSISQYGRRRMSNEDATNLLNAVWPDRRWILAVQMGPSSE